MLWIYRKIYQMRYSGKEVCDGNKNKEWQESGRWIRNCVYSEYKFDRLKWLWFLLKVIIYWRYGSYFSFGLL